MTEQEKQPEPDENIEPEQNQPQQADNEASQPIAQLLEEDPQVADLVYRVLARAIDSVVFTMFCGVVYPAGIFAGLLYLLIADGLMEGRSLGKRIIRLRVVSDIDGSPIGFRRAMIRNSPFVLVSFFAVIPIIGWILLFTVGMLILGAELYFAITDTRGQRIGDILAGTLVVDDRPTQNHKPDYEI